jgi:hypothetical protein
MSNFDLSKKPKQKRCTYRNLGTKGTPYAKEMHPASVTALVAALITGTNRDTDNDRDPHTRQPGLLISGHLQPWRRLDQISLKTF